MGEEPKYGEKKDLPLEERVKNRNFSDLTDKKRRKSENIWIFALKC